MSVLFNDAATRLATFLFRNSTQPSENALLLLPRLLALSEIQSTAW